MPIMCPWCKRNFEEIPAGSIVTLRMDPDGNQRIEHLDWCVECWEAYCRNNPDSEEERGTP